MTVQFCYDTLIKKDFSIMVAIISRGAVTKTYLTVNPYVIEPIREIPYTFELWDTNITKAFRHSPELEILAYSYVEYFNTIDFRFIYQVEYIIIESE